MKLNFKHFSYLLLAAGMILVGCSKDSTSPEGTGDDAADVSKDNSLTNFSFKADKNSSVSVNATGVKGAGIIDDTLFMVISDHGGTNDEKGKGSHGGWTDEEKYVTFAAVGEDINSGEIGEMNIRDLAAIVLYAMGIEAPAFDEKGWTSQIPDGLFKGYEGEYRDISHLTGAAPRISKTHHKSELV